MTTPHSSTPRVELRPVAPEDEEFLLDVYASTRADEMALVDWTDEIKRAFLRSQLTAQRADYEARFPAADYRVILADGAPAGRLWTARTAEQIRLLDIALLPEFQNRGVGKLLLRALIEESERARLPLRHMVYQFNEGGMRFYERLGFTPVGTAGAYVEMERVPPATAPPAS
ncbi:MAG: GNAT family N-acetyltransferase [Acidobacteria bacterium]|nr:GNAT family N-acetyltransferase [Acidobacteriota bacterium]